LYPSIDPPDLRVEDEQPKGLGLDHELPDRLLKQGFIDIDRYREVELSLCIRARQDLAVEHELPDRELKLADVRSPAEALHFDCNPPSVSLGSNRELTRKVYIYIARAVSETQRIMRDNPPVSG
jgi:hypothetical protein